MVDDNAARSVRAKGQALEIFRRHARKAQSRVDLESKTGVVVGIAENDTSSRPKQLYLIQARFD